MRKSPGFFTNFSGSGASSAANLLRDNIFREPSRSVPDRFTKPETGLFQHAHRSDVLREHQADDVFQRQIGKPETDGGNRSFGGKTKSPPSTHQTEADLDLTELFQIFETHKADIFTGTFEYAGPAPESVFSVIRYWMSKLSSPVNRNTSGSLFNRKNASASSTTYSRRNNRSVSRITFIARKHLLRVLPLRTHDDINQFRTS
jgi:hypothetical protein